MSVSAARTEIRNTESTYWQYAHYVVIVVVFTLNRSFYQRHTSAVHPVSVLILHPRETKILWSQTETEKTKKSNREQIKV